MRATIILLSATAASALSDFSDGTRLFSRVHGGSLEARQAFDPGETTGRGSTCVEAFGAGYIECVPKSATRTRPLCYNPTQGQSCCDNLWGCPRNSFCLVQDLCCPNGLDAKTCAIKNSVTLPPDFGVSKTSTTKKPSTTAPSSSPSAYTDDPTLSTTESEAAPTSTDYDYDSTTTISKNTVISYPSTTTNPGTGGNYSSTSKTPSSTSSTSSTSAVATAGAVREEVAFVAAILGFAAAFVL
ncbi:hypothetical protein B0H63DRAFT_510470 [Podospora didyma]|uniref:Uncharacterized protein n=1 Tax=Podospora didyma TaxID=330526 RepID=A0AAE0TZX9_9PEZI|nr:hypothetical protein B0H63DRAFT_510470 [Podospora didyma]